MRITLDLDDDVLASAKEIARRGKKTAGPLLGHRQVTDAWLLGLAVAHGLRQVGFDGGLPLRVVRGTTASHIVAI